MAEQIMGASGLPLVHVTDGGALVVSGNFVATVDTTTDDYISIVGSPNYQLPVEITTADYISVVGSPNYSLPIIGSVALSNASINVDVTVADYVSVIGSPNYNLPVIGSVQVSSINSALPAGTAILGSVKSEITASIPLDVNTTTADYISIVGSPNYSLPVTGSVQVSSIVGALPAGTSLIGSVVADVVGITTSDYISIVGSPNYNLPVIGSVQVSSIVNALPAGNNNIGDFDIASAIPAGTNIIGSVKAEITASTAIDVNTTTADYISIVGSPNYSLPVIGSVEVSSMRNPWSGIGSIVDQERVRDGSVLSFSWVGALTGSVMGIPPTGSRFEITDIVASASGQGIVTLFFNTDNLSNRIARGYLANFGGFATNYSKPLRGPVNGSLMITTAATGFTPVGDVTVGFTMSA